MTKTPHTAIKTAAVTFMALLVQAASAGELRAGHVLVVSSTGQPAFHEVISSMKTALRGHPLTILSLTDDQRSPLPGALNTKPSLIVTIGSRAAAEVAALDPSAPVLATLLLSGSGEEASPGAMSTLALQLPPAAVLARVKELLPGRKRIALIQNPANPVPAKVMQSAQRLGLNLQIIDCANPKELLDAVSRLRGKVDLIWCLPDRVLYQPASISAFILGCIKNRIPIIGFSESFVRAGALLGFYPDYQDLGLQIADLIRRYEQGERPAEVELPRQMTVSANERVMRMLGIRLAADAPGVVMIR